MHAHDHMHGHPHVHGNAYVHGHVHEHAHAHNHGHATYPHDEAAMKTTPAAICCPHFVSLDVPQFAQA